MVTSLGKISSPLTPKFGHRVSQLPARLLPNPAADLYWPSKLYNYAFLKDDSSGLCMWHPCTTKKRLLDAKKAPKIQLIAGLSPTKLACKTWSEKMLPRPTKIEETFREYFQQRPYREYLLVGHVTKWQVT